MTRHEVLGQIAVFVVMIASITGSALVLNIKRGDGLHLMPLVDGAFAGGVIAASAAVVFVGLACVLRSSVATAMQAVVSVLLVVLSGLSIYLVHVRIEAGESSDEFVAWGQGLYLVAFVLQIAAAIGFVRLRLQLALGG